MGADKPELGVRLARAYHSADLSHKAGPCDVDKLAAIGMATIGEPLQAELMRLRFDNDVHAYRPALAHLTQRVWQMSQRHDWQAIHHHCALLARAVLDYWIAPQCRACNGLGFRKAVGAPTLEARACPECQSSGMAKVRLPRALRANVWQRRWNDVYAWVHGQEVAAAVRVRAKLRTAPR